MSSEPTHTADPNDTISERPRLRGLLIFLLLALVAVAAFYVLVPHPVVPIREAEHQELVTSEDGMRLMGEEALFTGAMVGFYPDGQPRSRSEVVDGRLHGLSQGWYADGTMETEEYFENGVSHGQRTRWHANGQMASRADIRNGKVEGVFHRWHDNGQLAQSITMEAGVAHGLSEAFYPTGYLQARVVLEQGEVRSQEFFKDLEKKAD